MIDPEAEIAAAITENGPRRRARDAGDGRRAAPTGGRSSGQGRGLEVTEVAAPDLAPIIQHGYPSTRASSTRSAPTASRCSAAEVDTLILGCTHYPLVAPMLQRILGRDVRLVTAGHAIAAAAQRLLEARGLETARRGEGRYSFLCTGDVARSASSARASCRCRSATSSASDESPRITL